MAGKAGKQRDLWTMSKVLSFAAIAEAATGMAVAGYPVAGWAIAAESAAFWRGDTGCTSNRDRADCPSSMLDGSSRGCFFGRVDLQLQFDAQQIKGALLDFSRSCEQRHLGICSLSLSVRLSGADPGRSLSRPS